MQVVFYVLRCICFLSTQEEFSEDVAEESAAGASAGEAFAMPPPITMQPTSGSEQRSYGTIGGESTALTSGKEAGYQAS